MILQVPSRERSHIPPNGKRKIIDSKVPIPRSELQLGETLYHILLELLDLWNLHILKRPKCPGSCLFALYIYKNMYVIGSKKKKNCPELRLSWDLRWQQIDLHKLCAVFSLFSPATRSSNNQNRLQRFFANNRLSQGSWYYQPTQLHYCKGSPFKKITHRFAAWSLIPPKGKEGVVGM